MRKKTNAFLVRRNYNEGLKPFLAVSLSLAFSRFCFGYYFNIYIPRRLPLEEWDRGELIKTSCVLKVLILFSSIIEFRKVVGLTNSD